MAFPRVKVPSPFPSASWPAAEHQVKLSVQVDVLDYEVGKNRNNHIGRCRQSKKRWAFKSAVSVPQQYDRVGVTGVVRKSQDEILLTVPVHVSVACVVT